MNELISVIVPVYNVEKYLSKCIESILNQTYKNIEIILVDDGSTDQSGIICDNYAHTHQCIRTFHKANGGLSSARNYGLKQASGNYIGFVDSDDYIERDMYEYLYENLISNNADISICQRIIDNSGNLKYENRKTDEVISSDKALSYLLQNKIKNAVWDKLYKKEIVNDIEFPLNRNYESTAVTYKYILKANKIVLLKEGKYYYVQRDSSIVHHQNVKNTSDWAISQIERYNELISLFPQYKYDMLNSIYYLIINASVSLDYYPEEYSIYPDSLKLICDFIKNNQNEIEKAICADKYSKKKIALLSDGSFESFIKCNEIEKRHKTIRTRYRNSITKRKIVRTIKRVKDFLENIANRKKDLA